MQGKQLFRIALVGKTGHGKTSTGNTILRKQAFEDTNDAFSGTMIVDKRTAVIDNLFVQVFDTPGVIDTVLTEKSDKQKAVENMEILMKISGGIDAFLLVYNYTSRYTTEEKKAVELLEEIFGQTTLVNHGIIVVTHGDNLDSDLRDGENQEEKFAQWCSIQSDNFKALKSKMKNRIILVYNKGDFMTSSKRLNSSVQLLNLANQLYRTNGSFTKEDFDELKQKCCIIS